MEYEFLASLKLISEYLGSVRQKLLKIKGKLPISQLRATFSENQKADYKPLTPKKATSN